MKTWPVFCVLLAAACSSPAPVPTVTGTPAPTATPSPTDTATPVQTATINFPPFNLPPIGNLSVLFSSRVSGNGEIYAVNRDGSGLIQVTDNSSIWEGCPAWSPNGDQYAFATEVQVDDSSYSEYGIVVANLSGMIQARIVFPFSQIIPACPIWSPDGNWITLESSYAPVIFHPDGTSLKVLGDQDGWPLVNIEWLSDSQSIIYGNSAGIHITDLEGQTDTPVPMENWDFFSMRWFSISPGENLIAYVNENSNLSIYDMETQSIRQLTDKSQLLGRPVQWLSDTRLMYSVLQQRKWSIFGIDVDGANLENYTASVEYAYYFEISPNKDMIAFGDGKDGIEMLNVNDGKISSLAQVSGLVYPLHMKWSDDMKYLFVDCFDTFAIIDTEYGYVWQMGVSGADSTHDRKFP